MLNRFMFAKSGFLQNSFKGFFLGEELWNLLWGL